MPKSTDNKGHQLRSSLGKSQPIIHTLPQPLLNSHVPVTDLISDMNGRLDLPRIAHLNSKELIIYFGVGIVTDAAHVHGELRELPSEVVLAFYECDCPERVEVYIEMSFFVKFVSFHVVDWEVDHLDDVKPSAECADSQVFQRLFNAFPKRNVGKASLLIDVTVVSGVINWSIEDTGGNELQISQVIDKRWQFNNFILSLIGVLQFIIGECSILVSESKQRVFRDVQHENE